MSCRNRNSVYVPLMPAQQQAPPKSAVPVSALITFSVIFLLILSLLTIWSRPITKSGGPAPSAPPTMPVADAGQTEVPATGHIQITNPVFEESSEAPSETIPPTVETLDAWPDSRSSEVQALLESVSEKLVSDRPSMGDTVEISPWRITLTDAREYEILYGEDYFDFASEGCKLLVLFFDLENISDSEEDFDLYKIKASADWQALYSWVTMNNPDGYEQLHGVLAPGTVKKGCLVYEVPDDWKQLLISYKNSWDAEDSQIINFQLNHSQLSE